MNSLAKNNSLRPLALFGLMLWLADCLYLNQIQHVDLGSALMHSSLEVLACLLVFVMVFSISLFRLTVMYLALPYFLFFVGWLNTPTALFMTAGLMVVLYRSLRCDTTPVGDWQKSITPAAMLGFAGVLLWVHMSGAGGYSYQSADYHMHNGKLKDLVEYPWPVHYGENANLITYVAYYLPAALLGKMTDYSFAVRSMLPWTVMGVALVWRWLSHLSGTRPGLVLIAVFAFFGPLNILGVINKGSFPEFYFIEHTDKLDFWLKKPLGFFFGAFLSNTFQLYWAPHQVIAGWLMAGLLFHSVLARRADVIFLFSLCCLWSPLIMIGIAPLVLLVIVLIHTQNKHALINFSNIFPVLFLVPLFIAFYMAGSALINPYAWTVSLLNQDTVVWFFLAHFYGWALYALLCLPYLVSLKFERIIFYLGVFFTYFYVSNIVYGAFSDVICRSVAPMSFLLVLLIVMAFKHYGKTRQYWLRIALMVFLVIGSLSAILQNRTAIMNYGETKFPVRGNEYRFASEILGRDDAFFNRWFLRSLETGK